MDAPLKNDILKNINQAFLQLEFSLKLLTHFELVKVNKDEFDTNVRIRGKYINLDIPHNRFNTYNDLVIAADNTCSITLGFTSIVLDDSLQSAGFSHKPQDKSTDGLVRTLIYLIRCAYAHNMMYPIWEIKTKYIYKIEIPLKYEVIELDLSQKNGKPFHINDIGGFQNYLEIKDKVINLIETK